MKENIQKEIDEVTKTMETTFSKTTDRIARPVQNTLFKRFPITATLAIVFGITAVTYGTELIFNKIPFFTNNPVILVLCGIFALSITGKLYQKLG